MDREHAKRVCRDEAVSLPRSTKGVVGGVGGKWWVPVVEFDDLSISGGLICLVGSCNSMLGGVDGSVGAGAGSEAAK
jgi:hypothetical protein